MGGGGVKILTPGSRQRRTRIIEFGKEAFFLKAQISTTGRIVRLRPVAHFEIVLASYCALHIQENVVLKLISSLHHVWQSAMKFF